MKNVEGREISLVLGTAGHIDHGKTTLVKAVTGVDCDRLIEEKKRGITIELGFAPLQLDDGRIVSIVDVPGHERFIRQMVAGASGIDGVLLVIAADEGVMPQNPFASIDVDGVGQLVRMGVERGRAAKPGLKCGVCGEHGGDPDSIAFFQTAGLSYVSCSPFRVPIARFAAAKSALNEKNAAR